MNSKLVGRRHALKFLGVGALAAAPLVRAQSASANVCTIASVLPLSGGFAQYGKELARGVEIAVDAINSKGLRVGGKSLKVNLQTYDDKSDATTAARLTERAASADRANFTIAGCGSTIAKSIIPVAQRLRVPVLAQWAQVDGVFESQKGNPYYFGGMAPFSRVYDRFWELLPTLQNPQLRTVVMISPNDELGVFMDRQLAPQLQRSGMKHLHTELFPPTMQDFSAAVERCAAHKPDVLLINCYTPQIISVFKQIQAVNFFPPAIVVEAPTRLPEALGPDLNGAYVPSFWAASSTATRDAFVGTSADFSAAYQAKFKEPPPDFVAACGAANVLTCAQVAMRAGTVTDAGAILNAFRAFDGETFFAPVKFAANGLNIKAEVHGAQFQAGQVKLVFPASVKEAAVIHPHPLSRKS
jgi:branched-chain amino acid transport system substrate-binding protein